MRTREKGPPVPLSKDRKTHENMPGGATDSAVKGRKTHENTREGATGSAVKEMRADMWARKSHRFRCQRINTDMHDIVDLKAPSVVMSEKYGTRENLEGTAQFTVKEIQAAARIRKSPIESVVEGIRAH